MNTKPVWFDSNKVQATTGLNSQEDLFKALVWALSHEAVAESDPEQFRRFQADVWNSLYHAGLLPERGLGLHATTQDLRDCIAKQLQELSEKAEAGCRETCARLGVSFDDDSEESSAVTLPVPA